MAAPPNPLTLKLLSFCFAGMISILKVISSAEIVSEAVAVLTNLQRKERKREKETLPGESGPLEHLHSHSVGRGHGRGHTQLQRMQFSLLTAEYPADVRLCHQKEMMAVGWAPSKPGHCGVTELAFFVSQ